MSRVLKIQTVFAVVLTGCIVCSGCGGSSIQKTSVSGKVTLNGEPIELGQITFTPSAEGGSNSSGAASGEIKAGAYSISASEGPMVGKHSVSITASRKTGQQVAAAMPAPEGTMIDVTEDYIPYKYNFETTLTAELTSGENTKDFALEGEVKPAGK